MRPVVRRRVPLAHSTGTPMALSTWEISTLSAWQAAPAEAATERSSNEPTSVEANDAAPYSAFVWKTVADAFAGRITMFRVVSGTLKSDSTVTNATKETQERLARAQALSLRRRISVRAYETVVSGSTTITGLLIQWRTLSISPSLNREPYT